MLIDEIEQNKRIKDFIKKKSRTETSLFNFFYEYVLHPNLETDFTHKVVRNVIKVSHPYYLTLSDKQKYHFLKALAHLFDFALAMKIWEFQLSRDDADWYWKGIPTYFLTLTNLAESLEKIRYEMGMISKEHLYRKVILVEGVSEYNFVRTLQLTRSASFDFSTYCYSGKGEIQNLIHYIREKNRQGVKVFVSYDKDGRHVSFLQKIRKKCYLNRTFGFKRDFESSFPPEILKTALNYYLKKYAKKKLRLNNLDVQNLLNINKGFLKAFEDKYQVKISKPKLGNVLGQIIGYQIEEHGSKIFGGKKPSKNFQAEIYKFLKFMIRL